ncbi:MAG TPA: amidohydrolase family protein, partial [Woeseiaceae bacterium]|nr:amidohydrolase family protein [Woeseiaceae bacterium]
MHTLNIRHYAALCLLSALAACAPSGDEVQSAQDGLLIRDVQIVDGSGAAAYRGAVRLSGERIVEVGDGLEPRRGETVVEGAGRVLAPGFIDTHSHADRDLLAQPDALPAVSQGITTVVTGQDGGSPYPLAEFYGKLDEQTIAINLASYVGHNTLRANVMGKDYRRPATEAEIAAMAEMLDAELDSGALGLSSGLEYEPGIYSEPGEVLTLARLAAKRGGRYISHVRSEDRWFEQALEEIIEIGRVTG